MIASPRQCDLLIIGAGIAGVAIAERVAREAAERAKRLRVFVVDEAEQIGAGASRGLQGWFHSGALYARLRQEESFRQCALSRQLLRARYSAAMRHEWFAEPIEYYIDDDPHPDWGPQACKIARHARETAGTVRAHPNSLRIPGYSHAPSGDRAMRTQRILFDLAERASQHGVDFLLGRRARDDGDGCVTLSCPRETVEVRPAFTIWTAGCRTPNAQTFGLHRRSGVVLGVYPALDVPNMACIARNDDLNISHIAHSCSDANDGAYSALGNSVSLPASPSRELCEHTAQTILARARALFGVDTFTNRRVGWHTSTKIEARSIDGTEPLFGPVIHELSGNAVAVIPSKFSLFPLTAENVVLDLAARRFFAGLEDGASSSVGNPRELVVAPALAEQVLGIAGREISDARHHGALAADVYGQT